MPSNPYGKTKLAAEQFLRDFSTKSRSPWKIICLRYFNPIGSHPSGNFGESPLDVPNNLFPYICKVAQRKYERLKIFGNNWPTKDGTGVRDYIHVMDLARGHLEALNWLESEATAPCCKAVNLGTGQGYSVLEVIAAFEQASNKEVKYQIVERRAGDVATNYADPTLAKSLLGWTAEKSLEDMVTDAWRWQSQNPNGYGNA